jgi:hypothetical protein
MVHADVHEGPWFPVHHRDQDLSPEQIRGDGSGRGMSLTGINSCLTGTPSSQEERVGVAARSTNPRIGSQRGWRRRRAEGFARPASRRSSARPDRRSRHVGRGVAEVSSDELVQTEPLWPRYLDDTVQRRSDSDLADRARDIIGRDRWMRTGAKRTVSPSVASSAMLLMNSKNCVAWTIE